MIFMAQQSTKHRLAYDSDRQHLGGVYAKALLAATEKAGVTETVLDQLTAFVRDVIEPIANFDAVLSSPRVNQEEKTRLLDRAIGNKVHILLLNFLKVMARHGRLDCLRAVLAAAQHLYNEMRGRIEVVVESAAPLDASLRASIAARLQRSLGAEVLLQTKVNPEVLGGLVVRVGDTVYDASVSNQLSRLRRTVLATARQKMRDSVSRFAGN
jgi:F-type H+-transporting ATPase subunit delta